MQELEARILHPESGRVGGDPLPYRRVMRPCRLGWRYRGSYEPICYGCLVSSESTCARRHGLGLGQGCLA
jgi:hypothetical protein